MSTRRQFLNRMLKIVAAAGLGMAGTGGRVRMAFAEIKRKVLGKHTDLDDLVNENPARLDAARLPVTPREKFETMGLSDHDVAVADWRLTVGGDVKSASALTYEDLLQMPAVERSVLLICPGFFAYKGRWKGVSIRGLLEKTRIAAAGATHLVVSGPAAAYEKRERFEIAEIENDKLFLAYAVNGVPLPQKHGYPLRLVAEDHYGSRWVKYVEKIDIQKVQNR